MQMQQTFGIVPVHTRNDILKKMSKLEIIAERKFELSIESAKVLNKRIREAYTVFGFILEGSNAIEDWLNIIHDASQSKSLYHGSLNPDHAQTEIDWFRSTFTKDSMSSSSSSSSIPVKVINRKTVLKTKKVASVSGTSPHQSKRDTTPDGGPRLRKPTPVVRTSQIPNAKTTTPPPLKSTRISPPPSSAKPPTRTTTTAKRSEIGRSELRTEPRRSSLATKKLSTTTKGGVSKNTPPTSVITGRTRKPSKLTEKRPIIAAKTKPVEEDEAIVVEDKAKAAVEVEPVEEEVQPAAVEVEAEEVAAEEVEAVAEPETPIVQETIIPQEASIAQSSIPQETAMAQETDITQQEKSEVEQTEAEETEECHIILAQQPVSHPSTTSSADEHDAEVAAAINNEHHNNVKIAANLFQNSGRSSSFSPSSVSSLPRPETPEVDQLRLRFETIIQTSGPTSPNEFQPFPRRPSSKMSPEFISRIKEMKPKGPVGSKVKSMVELFMDENLNKWEF